MWSHTAGLLPGLPVCCHKLPQRLRRVRPRHRLQRLPLASRAATALTLSAAAQVCLRAPCRPVLRRQAAPRQLGLCCRHAHASAAAAAAAEQAAPDRPKGKAKAKAKDASECLTRRTLQVLVRPLRTTCAALTSSRHAQTTRPTRTRSTCQRPPSTCGPTLRSGSQSCRSSGMPTAFTSSCWRPTRGCVLAALLKHAGPLQACC